MDTPDKSYSKPQAAACGASHVKRILIVFYFVVAFLAEGAKKPNAIAYSKASFSSISVIRGERENGRAYSDMLPVLIPLRFPVTHSCTH